MTRLELIEGESAPPPPIDDRATALWCRARAGDVEAWSRLYQEHFDGLFRHLRYLSGDPVATEELVQETFARAFAHVAAFRGESSFTTWLHGIGINVVRLHWRSAKRQGAARQRLQEADDVAADAVEQPDRSVLRRQRAAALYAALEQLPDNLREAFVLRDLEQLSPAEAAAQLGITSNNVNVRAARARQRLRRELTALERGGSQ